MRVFATGEVGHALLKRGRGGNGNQLQIAAPSYYRRQCCGGWIQASD